MEFLDWADRTGELPKATVTNWRGASNKVLEIDEGWETLDVVGLDVDAFLSRFENLCRTKYKTDSLNAYKGRFRKAVESFRTWLQDPSGSAWKQGQQQRSATNSRTGETKKRRETASGTTGHAPAAVADSVPVVATTGMVDYPLPLRQGVRARLVLPEDLTKKEAQRIAAFVGSLAFDERLAITAGEPDAE